MRRGEMLALRFGDIDWTRHRMMLRGETTKSGKGARGATRDRALASRARMASVQAEGEKKPDAALVFSDETGLPVGAFSTAWITAVLKAHTVNPEWRMYG